MKKMLFGAVLLLSGVLGFVGWAIACAVANEGWSVLACVDSISDVIVLGLFVLMAAAGLVVCFREWNTP